MNRHQIIDLKNIPLIAAFMAFLVFGLTFPTMAAGFDCCGVDVVDYGIYKTDFIKWEGAPKTDVGKIEIVSDKKLVRLTDYIPAKKGTQFGMRYVLNGEPRGEDVAISVKVLHSAKVNEKEISRTNEWTTTKRIGGSIFVGWKFNTESELIHGNWTIQLYHKGMKLAEKRFYVY